MATATDPRGVGRGCDKQAVPDPQMNASRILAWAICWPWNLLWTVCVFNPIVYVFEIAVREFRSALEQISSGQFREIEHELFGDDAAPQIVIPPHLGQSLLSGVADRPTLVVGDPLPCWSPDAARHAIEVVPAIADSLPKPQSVACSAQPVPSADAPVDGQTRDVSGSAGAIGVGQILATNTDGSWSWRPPTAAWNDSGSSVPETWYPVGDVKDAPVVASASLSPNVRKQPPVFGAATELPSSLFDAWYHLPPAGEGSGRAPLN